MQTDGTAAPPAMIRDPRIDRQLSQADFGGKEVWTLLTFVGVFQVWVSEAIEILSLIPKRKSERHAPKSRRALDCPLAASGPWLAEFVCK